MPHVAPGMGVFCFVGKKWHVAHFCLWNISKDSANILVVWRARFVNSFSKSIGAILHPVWEQQEDSCCLLVI